MDTIIIVSLIGLAGTIVAAIIGVLVKRRNKSRLNLIDTNVFLPPRITHTPAKSNCLEYSVTEPKLHFPHQTDALGVGHFFPIIDIKFVNSGDGVAYLKRMQIDVSEMTVDPTPILEFYIKSDRKGNLVITIKNCGWGPALSVKLDNIVHDELRKYLNLMGHEYLWEGDIQAEEVITIDFPYSFIREATKAIEVQEPGGYIVYRDSQNNEYGRTIRYSPYPFEEYRVIIEDNKFKVVLHDLARAREVSCRHTVMLPTTPKQYTKTYSISMEVGPNETERFQVILATEKSATFTALFKIHYNQDQMIQTMPLKNMRVWNPNGLWYYNHLKQSAIIGGELENLSLDGKEVEEENNRNRDVNSENMESAAWAFNDIAWVLIDGETNINISEGVRLAEKALTLKSDEPFILDTIGWGNYKLGHHRKALDFLKRAIQKAPEDDLIKEHLEIVLSIIEKERK